MLPLLWAICSSSALLLHSSPSQRSIDWLIFTTAVRAEYNISCIITPAFVLLYEAHYSHTGFSHFCGCVLTSGVILLISNLALGPCKSFKMGAGPYFQQCKSHAACRLWALAGQSKARKACGHSFLIFFCRLSFRPRM